MDKKDRLKGCIFLGAMGDALGYPIEFKNYSLIKNYNLNQLTIEGEKALFSDDTQMTLFTLEALLNSNGIKQSLINILSSYKYWYNTQGISKLDFNYSYKSLLYNENKLYSNRAPGNTCLFSIRDIPKNVIQKVNIDDNIVDITNILSPSNNNSCGCGGVMRVAPIGFFFGPYDSYILGRESARITHKNPLGYEPAGILACIISFLNKDYQLEHSIKKSLKYTNNKELKKLIKKSIYLSKTEIKDIDAIKELGEGWTGHEALSLAIFCSLRYKNDMKKALITAVNHDGDSDSIGAITGNILGTYYGDKEYPYNKNDLECLEIIENLLNKFKNPL